MAHQHVVEVEPDGAPGSPEAQDLREAHVDAVDAIGIELPGQREVHSRVLGVAGKRTSERRDHLGVGDGVVGRQRCTVGRHSPTRRRIGLRPQDRAHLHVDLRHDVIGEAAPVPQPHLVDLARADLLVPQCLGQRGGDLAGVPDATAGTEAALQREAVVHTGIHGQVGPLPVRRDVAVVTRERVVVVHTPERRLLQQHVGHRLAAGGQIGVRRCGERQRVVVLRPDRAIVGVERVGPSGGCRRFQPTPAAAARAGATGRTASRTGARSTPRAHQG